MHTRLTSERWALIPIRLIVGIGFFVHGYAKASRGVDGFAAALAAMDVPAPQVAAWLTTVLELAGGVALIAGAFVVPLAAPLAVIMLTALFRVHLRYGFSSIKLVAFGDAGATFGPPGVEMNLLYLAGLAALVLAGPSPLSVDRWLSQKRMDP